MKIPINWLQVEVSEAEPHVGRMELLRRTIKTLKPGTAMSFTWELDNTLVYRAAKQLDARIRTEKQDGAGVRVWRLQ